MVKATKTKEELLNSRPLDVYRASYWSEAIDLVDSIYSQYLYSKNDKFNQIQRRHLVKIILHLYVTWFEDPNLCTAISFDNNSYKKDSRYNKIN